MPSAIFFIGERNLIKLLQNKKNQKSDILKTTEISETSQNSMVLLLALKILMRVIFLEHRRN